MRKIKKLVATTFATGLMAVGVAAPTASAQPVITGGLVNVTLVDVLSHDEIAVQVPIGVAANVCDVNAAVLLAAIEDTGSARCDATSNAIAFAEQHQR
jgi:hypothetical protein